jgi:DNA repair exonuclease SbcCD nuclease subunit
MKIGIISDTHYGARKNSKLFHDYFKKFYHNVFFPTLDKEEIKTVIHMGDAFDSRKGIDFSALAWSKDNIFDPLKKRGIKLHLIVGNHDSYYKNTNEVNAVDLLLREYDNVEIISDPTEVLVDKLKVLFIPWINQENEKKTLKMIENTKSSVAMGHLELNGFNSHRGHVMDHGMETKIFNKFEKVFSGHYHTRSNDGKIFYLGNPYEIYWNDVNDDRGFTLFDTDTLEHVPVNNPFRMFYNIYYEDTNPQLFDTREYEEKIVKVIVRKKSDTKQFEKFIDKLYAANVAELKIVENFQIIDDDEFEGFESEDTISILNRYIEESEVNLDKSVIQKIISEIYKEACEMA